jgi:uncharacterized membrane protein YqgA involved in biofilm formation
MSTGSIIVVLLGAIIGGMWLITQKLDRIIALLERNCQALDSVYQRLHGIDARGHRDEMNRS